MRILLVNPRGFCAGVEMAIEVVEQILEAMAEAGASDPVYVYHEIVHNKHVVSRFHHRGVVFVEEIDAIPEGSVVVFSAHGVSPEVRQQARARNLTAIDATCPLVTKVHAEAIRYSRQGYQILLVGHRDHQEVVGTRGEAPNAIQVVESPDDIPALRIDDPDRLVYLTQTTLSTDDAGVIIDALKAAFPNIKEPPSSDICYATTNRQHAVRTFAPRADLVLVVGSENSSNSVRLTEIAQNVGTPGKRVDDASELRDEWFEGVETVLVTAGASAPEDLVAGVCRTLIENFGGEIEIVSTVDEDQEFNLPASLRRWKSDRGIDGANERMRIGHYDYSVEMYGAVPLTISAKR
jgi:4-hydroxy-3-methylbut-2-enyl diphosphate reductase